MTNPRLAAAGIVKPVSFTLLAAGSVAIHEQLAPHVRSTNSVTDLLGATH